MDEVMFMFMFSKTLVQINKFKVKKEDEIEHPNSNH